MAWSLVGSDVVEFSDGGSGHVYTFPSGPPTAGDIDVLTVSSNTTLTTPSGFTLPANGSRVGGQGAYAYYRIAAGGEGSTVTVVTNGNEPTTFGWQRWRGGGTFDQAAQTGVDASNGTSAGPTSTGALAGTGELVIALAALHTFSATPSGPTWSAGYTGLLVGGDATVTAQFTAYRTDAGMAAETVSVDSWTNAASDRYLILLAFTPNAAPPTPPAVTAGVMGWDLVSTLALQTDYRQYYDSTLPTACPFDGTPLKEGPASRPGVLYCPNGDFRYPEDWNPDTMSGM